MQGLAEPLPPGEGALLRALAFVADQVPPMALLAAALMLGSLVADALLAKRYAGGDGGADGGSCWALVVSLSSWMALGLLLSAWPAWRLPGLEAARGFGDGPDWGLSGGGPWAWLWWGPGLALASLGLALRYGAIAALGEAFTWRVAASPTQGLRRDGLYARVRHPSYLGGLSAGVGLLLMCGAWPPLLGFVLVHGAIVAWRIRREDEALATAHGALWQAYAAEVPALWPFGRRSGGMMKAQGDRP